MVTHSIADTITVDDDVLHSTLVHLEVLFTCVHVAIPHCISVNNFFSLHLVVDLRIVLGELAVQSGAEANDRLGTEVTHINSNKHCFFMRELGKGQMVEIATRLGIDLSQDGRGQLVAEAFLVLSFAQVLLEDDLGNDARPV